MSKTYTMLRAVHNPDDGSWSVYASWYDDDDQDGEPIGDVEWEVPEWTGLESEAHALEIIKGYDQGTLPDDLRPRHPHYHT